MPSDSTILVINAGSSSIKFSVFAAAGRKLVLKGRGQVEGVGAGIARRKFA